MSNFKDTLNLPKTDFPMKANLTQREPKQIANWIDEDAYGKLRQARDGAPKFVLHCGPPYANGKFHAGHVLSGTLKDLVVRSKSMAGFDAPFIPGWDCHGLPIEWKIEEQLRSKGKTKDDLPQETFLRLCREYAEKWVKVQKSDWQRMGSMGDFDNPYLTMAKQNEADILRELGKIAQTGLLHKGYRPVSWAIAEETALAEAEVEYADLDSTAVYVKFPLTREAFNGTEDNKQGSTKPNEFVLAWTTTPWTLPSNRAIAFGADIKYIAIQPTATHEKATASKDEIYWLAADLAEACCKMLGIESYDLVKCQQGKDFTDSACEQVLYNNSVPMIAGHHVTTEAGTGFVHIAPAHGEDDFQIGKEYDLDLNCYVDGKGRYEEKIADLPVTGEKLTGNIIWDMQKVIVAEMEASGRLLRWHKLNHSYPISWRSKTPLITRTTRQWFVSMNKAYGENKNTLREKALAEVKKVNWVPEYGEQRISNMVSGRPDWCVSRQRFWGVPIAIFFNKKTEEFILDAEVFESVALQIEKHSISAWTALSTEELLPEGWLAANNLTADDLVKETDILDVWFDSGVSYAHTVQKREGLQFPADLYLEGSDQHRGWFQSSLLASTAVNGVAPYKNVLTHGFVVDGEGKKMSKSIGNADDAIDLMEKYGADILRLWVTSSDYREDIRFSDEIIKGVTDAYRRFRNTIRYMLGNTHDFNASEQAVAYADLPELEKYVLARFAEVLSEVQQAYSEFQFYKAYQALYHFCGQELSSLYFDVRKDVLYCDEQNSHARRSCQTVLEILFRGIITHLAPMIPFTADEAWRNLFGDDKPVYLESFAFSKAVDSNESSELDSWKNNDLLDKWEKILEVKSMISGAIETQARQAGWAGSSAEVQVALSLSADLAEAVTPEMLCELCMVEKVAITVAENGDEVIVTKAEGEKCPRCWNYAELSEQGVCPRCDAAVGKVAEAC